MSQQGADFSSTTDAGLPAPLSLAVSTPATRRDGSVRVLVAQSPADAAGDADGHDICLTTSPLPARPWVCVDDLPGAIQALRATFLRSPLATVCAARLLRIPQVSIEDGLFTESLALSTLLGGAEFRRWLSERQPPQRAAARSPRVAYRRVDDQVEIRFGDGQVNALSATLRDALHETLETCVLDPTRPRVHLSGVGSTFCAGGALDEFGRSDDLSLAHAIRLERSIALLAHRLGERGQVHLNGPAIGAGIEFAAAAHRLSASRQAWVQLPELAMGLIPGAGGTVFMPRRIGRQRTLFLLLSAQRLDAMTALHWGLVDEVCD